MSEPMVVLIGVWLACAVLMFGMMLANIQAHWKGSGYEQREYRGHAGGCLVFTMFFGALGPLGLLLVWAMTGFAEHGLQYRRPR